MRVLNAAVVAGEVLMGADFVGDCFADDHPAPREVCCRSGAHPGCFDSYFTAQRCCVPDAGLAAFRQRAESVNIVIDECLAEKPASCSSLCNSMVVSEDCREFCDVGLAGAGPSEPHAVNGASVLGRVTYCLARSQLVRSALDLFGGTGGSAALIAHALRQSAPPGQPAPLVTFEMSEDVRALLMEALKVFDPISVPVDHGENQRQLSNAVSGTGLRVVVLAGEAYPLYECGNTHCHVGKYSLEPSQLENLCGIAPMDLVFLDAPFPASREWLVVDKFCKPRFVVVYGSSLPSGPGWIREQLLSWPHWAELRTGILADPHASGPGHEIGRVRKWSVLMRDFAADYH
mmetsp:Transcript_82070/g.187807  ORF Transcript_82070/g.187807 Transcript_82070/m.187807 type:complete len:346 (+) Transcript_82070:26-1063(+)